MKINIAKHLLELLLERGEITIPGLGKFAVQSNPASFGEGRKSLLPPTKGFLFDENHNSEDDVFKNHLINHENITAEQADQFVSKFTANVMEGLMANKPVELAYIGILKRDEAKGTLDFLQNSLTLAKINQGLPEVGLPDPKSVGSIPKKDLPVPETVPAKTTTPADANKQKESELKSEPIKQKPVEEKSQPKPMYDEPKERGCWPWIVGAILLIGALSILTVKMCSTDNSDVYKSIDSTPVVEVEKTGNEEEMTIGNEAAVMETDDAEAEPISDHQESNDEEEILSTVAANDSSNDCIVIVASMQNQNNIDRLIKKVQSKGYQLYTESHGAYTRVGVSINCSDLPGSYKEYIRNVSNDFQVNAWSLSPEFPQ